MSQVDLATLVSACAGGGSSDRKIACETLADDDEQKPDKVTPDLAPDVPPESFWLSKDAEYDWFDRNAVLERKESTRGNSNSANLNPNLHPSSNPSSQRFSKTAMIGLPKTQKTTYADPTKRKSTIRLFPKRSASVVKAGVVEPSSPKVSCIGRVRSKRGRRKSSGSTDQTTSIERKRNGGCGFCMAIFGSGQRSKEADQAVESPPRRSGASKPHQYPARAESMAAAEPPGLGGMARFASGRKSSASWGIDDAGVETR